MPSGTPFAEGSPGGKMQSSTPRSYLNAGGGETHTDVSNVKAGMLWKCADRVLTLS